MDSDRKWSLPVGKIKENFIEEIESWVSREASTSVGGVSGQEPQFRKESRGDGDEQCKQSKELGKGRVL